MLGDDNKGYMFLYNPTMREINVSLPLSGDSSASLGFRCSGNDSVLVKQVTSSERSSPSAQAYDVDLVKCAEGNLALTLPPTTARVFEFAPWENSAPTPVALGAPAASVKVDSNGAVTVVGAQGESGVPKECPHPAFGDGVGSHNAAGARPEKFCREQIISMRACSKSFRCNHFDQDVW